MKHLSKVTTPIAVSLALMTATLPASGESYGPFLYTDNVISVTITDYTGAGGSLAIPSKIAGKPVTAIGDWAFNDCPQLTKVTIPSSISFIGKNAFGFCSGVTSISVPNSVTYIGDGAFHDCSNLSSFTIPNRIRNINYQAFSGCSNLTTVTIPPSVTEVSWYAFKGCTKLSRVTIPADVRAIGMMAFYQCGLSEALFLGDAPSLERYSFGSMPSNFKVVCLQGSFGFTTPTWNGLQCVRIIPAPEIAVQMSNGKSAVDGKTTKRFGTKKIGKSGTAKIFTIKNVGTSNLRISKIFLRGYHRKDFVVRKTGKRTLTPGATTTFKITFKPKKKGKRIATVKIKNNDKNENTFDIKLLGKGK